MNQFVPSEFYLGQNYPNPFEDKTIIKYCIAYKTRVQITVYNNEGEVIEKLVDEEKEPGTYEVEFPMCHSGLSTESGGESLPNIKTRNLGDGYYFYDMTAGDFSSEKRWLCKSALL